MMSEVVTIEVLTQEKCLADMPYVILLEILRRLPKGRLNEISKLCSKFRDTARDKRLWKNVRIKYAAYAYGWRPTGKIFAFEDLYSEPWPVKVIDLSETKICPPVTSHIDQVIKVAKLDLSFINAEEATMAAILNKYQCRELYLQKRINIAPEVFSKQTALEVLSLGRITGANFLNSSIAIFHGLIDEIDQWLKAVLRNCKNLKTLDLRYWRLSGYYKPAMLTFIENLPASLEKLLITGCMPEDYFFQLLAGSTPNLKELELSAPNVLCPSLLEFKFLEALHIIPDNHLDTRNISGLHTYLIKFPALKTVYIGVIHEFMNNDHVDRNYYRELGTMLQPYNISVEPTIYPEWPPYTEEDDDLWNVL